MHYIKLRAGALRAIMEAVDGWRDIANGMRDEQAQALPKLAEEKQFAKLAEAAGEVAQLSKELDIATELFNQCSGILNNEGRLARGAELDLEYSRDELFLIDKALDSYVDMTADHTCEYIPHIPSLDRHEVTYSRVEAAQMRAKHAALLDNVVEGARALGQIQQLLKDVR